MVEEIVQFRHLIAISSRRFTHELCHMALQAKHSVLGLTGKELMRRAVQAPPLFAPVFS